MKLTNHVLHTVPQQDLEEDLECREEARLRADEEMERGGRWVNAHRAVMLVAESLGEPLGRHYDVAIAIGD